MLLNVIGVTIVGIAVFILMFIVGYKMFVKKERIDTSHSYTPFDYITGQTSQEFHEEELVHEEQNGDDNPPTPRNSN